MYDKTDVQFLGQKSSQEQQQQPQKTNEILLNSFFIKKKRYRVLLNLDKLIWEPEDKINSQKELFVYDIIAINETNGKCNNNNFIKKTICQQCQNNIIIPSNNTSTISASNLPSPLQPVQFSNQAFQQTEESNDDFNEINDATQATATATTNPENNLIIKKQYLLIHYASRLKESRSRDHQNRWRKKQLILFNSDPRIIKQWYLIIKGILDGQQQRPKNLLMFVNPYGGRKRGIQIYQKQCAPLFKLAGIEVRVVLTQHSRQIRNDLMTESLELYDGVCCVGGDGTFAEIFNGILYRTLKDSNLDFVQPNYIPKPKLALGVIPGGSTDTIAYCMHGTLDIQTAAIHIILGQRRGLDLASVWNSRGLIRFYCSVLSYGFLGDIAMDSERFRWMGPKRYEYSGFKKFFANRGYYGEIILLSDESQAENSIASTSIGDDSIPIDEDDQQQVVAADSNADFREKSLKIGNSSSSLDNGVVVVDSADKKCYINCMRCESSLQSFNMKNSTNKLNENPNSSDLGAAADSNATTATTTNLNYRKSCDSLIYESNDKYDEELRKILNFRQFVDDGDGDDDDRLSAGKRVQSSKSVAMLSEDGGSTAGGNCDIDVDASAAAGNNKWKIIKGKFFLVSAPNISCACNRSPKGLSEFSHLGDGYLDIILVRHTNFFNNIRLLLQMSSRRGNISNLPFVESYRTKKFLFKSQKSYPSTADLITSTSAGSMEDNNTTTSQWNCDGELILDSDLVIRSHCQLVDVFMRGPYPIDDMDGCCGKF